MKKTVVAVAAAAVIVSLLLPWAAVTFVPGDAGMAVCFLLFYGVNPIYSAAMGVFAGMKLRRRWCIPLLTSALILLGMQLLFAAGERAFLIYTAAYVIIGSVFMLISALINKKTQ